MSEVVYWGHGSETLAEYPTKQKIESATTNCSAVRFIWDDGTVDELSGSQGFSSTLPIARVNGGSFVSRYWFKHGCTFAYSINSCPNYRRFPRRTLVITNNSVGEFSHYAVRFCRSIFNNHSPNRIHVIHSQRTASPPPYDFQDTGLFGATTYEPNDVLSGDYQKISEQEVWTYWTDKEPAVNYKPSDTPPTIQADNNEIAISYADGTTEELPIGTCPEWVRIRDCEECPEGTCRVECGDHYCCYDCGGNPVKTIPKTGNS